MPRRSLLLSALAGLVTAIATAPPVRPLLALLLAPLLLVALEPACTAARARRRFGAGVLLGGLAGVVYHALVLAWAPGVISRFGGHSLALAVPAAVALDLLQALPLALAAGVSALVCPGRAHLGWALPAALTVSFGWVPMLFPWSPADLMVPFTPFVQVAELGGPPLVHLLMGLGACYLADASRRRAWAPGLVGLLLLAAPTVYGLARIPAVEAERAAAPRLRVGVIQPNVTIAEGTDPTTGPARLARLRRATAALEAEGAELVAWPESAYPYPIGRDRTSDLGGPLALRSDGVRGPVVFGAMTDAGGCDRWNTVIAMDAAGRFAMADKVALVPFAETVPFWHLLPPLRERYACPGLRAGAGPRVLEVGGHRVGVLNCYEDVTPAHAAALAGDAPELLLNASNDAWFGTDLFPHLHHGVARLRAVESRRDLVRVVNRGIGAHVAATGEDLARTRPARAERFVAEVALLRGTTPFHAIGDWVTPLAALALLGLALRGSTGTSSVDRLTGSA